MALLKAFVCQVLLLGLYKVFLEKVVEEHLVPDELTRNCLVGFVCLLCFGIQLYTEKIEEQANHEQASRSKSRRRSPPDMAESVSEFLDARTVHMMKTLDAAMQHMGQMPVSDGYVQNVVFAAAGPEAAVIEQTFSKQNDGVVVEEIRMTKLDVAEKSKIHENEPIAVPLKVEEVEEEEENDSEEEEVEEEIETKSDVCEEEEDDVVTVIDATKPKLEVAESEEEEEEEEETESVIVVNQKTVKAEVKPDIKPSKKDEDEGDEEEEEEEEETESVITVNQNSVKAEVKSDTKLSKDEEEDEEEEEEEEESEEEENEPKIHKK